MVAASLSPHCRSDRIRQSKHWQTAALNRRRERSLRFFSGCDAQRCTLSRPSYADEENTLKALAVALVDLKLDYEKDNWDVDLNVTNLFDKNYVADVRTFIFVALVKDAKRS